MTGETLIFYSHKNPRRRLIDHILDTGKYAMNICSTIPILRDYRDLVSIVAYSHDFGKYTTFFQKYLDSDGGYRKPETKHSIISSLFAAWLADQSYGDPLTSYVVSSVVASHHTYLHGLGHLDDLYYLWENILVKQVHDLRKNVAIITDEYSILGINNVSYFLDNFSQIYEKTRRIIKKLMGYNGFGWNTYFLMSSLYSTLLVADIISAMGIGLPKPKRELTYEKLYNFMRSKFSDMEKDVVRYRWSVFKSIISRMGEYIKRDSVPRIIVLRSPTGSGKTYAGLASALLLREYLERKHGKYYRIIYSLPYVNITNQVYKAIKNAIIGSGGGADYASLIMTHHLYMPENDDENESERYEAYSIWFADIIVTTFVQLIHAFLNTRKQFMVKNHALANSIIILDEVQAINENFWIIIKEAIKEVSERYDCYFIIMSATVPSPFNYGDSADISPEDELRQAELSKVIVEYDPGDITIRDLAKMIVEKIDESDSVLAVVNTIESSINLYNEVKRILGPSSTPIISNKPADINSDVVIVYLSSNIIPIHRWSRVGWLKSALGDRHRKMKIITISTQVVEAGVDLDFESGFRDIAPIDSIAQVAGRINRACRPEVGHMLVVNLIKDGGQEYASHVYGNTLIDVARDVLSKRRRIKKNELDLIVDEYYRKVFGVIGGKVSSKAKTLLDDIKELLLEKMMNFNILQDKYQRTSVFVEIDGSASAARNNYLAIIEKRKKGNINWSELAKAKRVLKPYILDTWLDVSHLPIITGETDTESGSLRYINFDEVRRHYDAETGLILDDDFIIP